MSTPGWSRLPRRSDRRKALTFLADRFIDLRGRRGPATTSAPVDGSHGELGDPAGKSVLDPACRAGRLLAAAAARGAARVLGQDADVDNVTIAAASLGVATANADIRHGTLRDDAFPDAHADVVLSDPPTGGNWGFDELAADMRWEYSTPPRTETELAWVQHALARLRPGGTAILLLPPGVAERTAGRRIRRELVRRGALEAIIALPSGATPPHNMRLHLWVMCRPLDRRTARDVLMVDARVRGMRPRHHQTAMSEYGHGRSIAGRAHRACPPSSRRSDSSVRTSTSPRPATYPVPSRRSPLPRSRPAQAVA